MFRFIQFRFVCIIPQNEKRCNSFPSAHSPDRGSKRKALEGESLRGGKSMIHLDKLVFLVSDVWMLHLEISFLETT